MRFLADENVESAVVEALRHLGHDILEVGEVNPGIDDGAVVRLAAREKRVLITNDKDFGEITVRRGQRIPGVLLLRLPGRTGSAKAPVAASAVRGAGSHLLGRIHVVEPGRVRSRPLRPE